MNMNIYLQWRIQQNVLGGAKLHSKFMERKSQRKYAQSRWYEGLPGLDTRVTTGSRNIKTIKKGKMIYTKVLNYQTTFKGFII